MNPDPRHAPKVDPNPPRVHNRPSDYDLRSRQVEALEDIAVSLRLMSGRLLG